MAIDWPFIIPSNHLNCNPKGLEGQTLDLHPVGHVPPLRVSAGFDVASFRWVISFPLVQSLL